MHPTTLRRLTTLVFSLLAIFACALAIEPGGARSTMVLSNVVQAFAPAIAAAGFWFASRAATEASHRRAWRFLGLSALSWMLGQVAWTYYAVTGYAAPYPSVADVGYLLAIPLSWMGVWSLWPRTATSTRLVAAMDGVITTCGVLAISWPLVLGEAWHSGGDDLLSFALSIAYPAGNLVVMASILVVIMRSGRGSGPIPLWHLACGLFTLVVADSVFVLQTMQGTESNTSIADLGWTGGYLILFLAAMAYLARREAPSLEGSAALSVRRALLPFAVVSLSLGVRLWMELTGRPDDGFLVGVTLVTVALVLVRQLLTMQENADLTRSLEEKIGELTTREEQLSHQAFHDPLTGLANRRLFSDRVDHALTLSRRYGVATAVLFVDLDDFKTVNDSLGHAVGDQLLVAVGTRLSGCVRPGDTVARLGGDEFGILLEEVADDEYPALVADRMLGALEVAFPIGGRQVFTRASIGVALSHPGGSSVSGGVDYDTEKILGDADVALYAAKGAGKSTFRRFERTMRVSALERLELGQDLRRAIDEDQFFCDYQPIVDLVTRKVVGLEALVRWEHPRRGLIGPNAFVELAEETGMIGPIGQRVLEIAATQVASWRGEGSVPAGLELHVNLSGRQLEDPDLAQQVGRVLAATGLPPQQLVLEITESVAVDIGARNIERLNGLRELGVRIAIDDFGTGYSSLNYLRALPVDVLKIDRAFAETMDGVTDSVLLEAIVRLGHSLGIEMIAEGIEREEQAITLRRLGCRRAQGFLFFRPASGDDVPRLVATAGRRPTSGPEPTAAREAPEAPEAPVTPEATPADGDVAADRHAEDSRAE